MQRCIIILTILISVTTAVMGQRRVSLYDEWFHSASCLLHREVSGDSVAYCLSVTLDEGNINIPRGSHLELRLRGGITVELTSARDITRRDYMRRRYVDHSDSYITCHYHITEDQLLQLHEHELLWLRIETSQGWIERRAIRHLKLY